MIELVKNEGEEILMLEQNAQNGGQQTATPPATPEVPEAMAAGVFLEDMMKVRGGDPRVTEEMSDFEREQLEEQFRLRTRLDMSDIAEGIKELIPEITTADSQAFVRGWFSRDPIATAKALQTAMRKVFEKEANEKGRKELRVEGANSGSKGNERAPIRSMGDAILQVSDSYR